jgi:hypothetical protein
MLANMNTLIVLFGLFLVTLVLAWIFLSVGVTGRKSKDSRKRQTSSCSPGCLFTLILSLIILCILLSIAVLRSYQAFTKEELVAVVRCEKVTSDSADFKLLFTPVIKEQEKEQETFVIRGKQWAVGGHIIKWSNSLNLLGLHSMYKLTRIEGKYISAYDERTNQATVYSLTEKESDPLWKIMYKYGHRLPFIQSVYGNSVFTYPSFRGEFRVFVTTSGFTIKFSGDSNRAKSEETTVTRDRPER